MSVVLAEHDPGWAEQATRARAELSDALPDLFLGLEPVGSTSVPGLVAKPVIDLMAAVTALKDVTADREAAPGACPWCPSGRSGVTAPWRGRQARSSAVPAERPGDVAGQHRPQAYHDRTRSSRPWSARRPSVAAGLAAPSSSAQADNRAVCRGGQLTVMWVSSGPSAVAWTLPRKNVDAGYCSSGAVARR
ncbi:GrpB family protein [Streptomyces sp. 8K308]|uniref:GrpB family protein n=1 Tax=Streptomyces sp. 8K308 TaxID=2530388 RepID=UPI001A9F8F4C|nr:GrpB family protein [Streptomyces sp. 8K308]